MKVLQVLRTSGPGGAESVVATLSRGIMDSDIEVIVASSGRNEHLYQKLDDLGIEAIRLKSTGIRSLIKELTDLIHSAQPKIIQSHMFDANLPIAIAARLCRIPCILTLHSTVYETDSRKRRLIYLFLSRFVERIVGVSGTVTTALIESRVDQRKLIRIHNGVDAHRFSGLRDTSFREELGIPENSTVVGMVANVRPAKDHALFIEAAAEVVKAIPSVRFVLVGDGAGPESKELQELRSNLALDEYVYLAGIRNDIPTVLSSFDLFVLASKIEGFPVSIVEAMLSGLPVVASDVGGVHEAVKDGITGLLVPPADRIALSRAISAILTNPVKSADMGHEGRRRAMIGFSSEAMVKAYMELYQDCLIFPTGRRIH